MTYEEKPVELDVSVTQTGIGQSKLYHGIDIYYQVEVLSPDQQKTLFHTNSKIPAIEKDAVVRSFSTGDPEIILYHDAVDRCLFSSLFACLGDLVLIGLGKKTYLEFLDEILSTAEDLEDRFLSDALSVLDQYPFEMAKSAVKMFIKYTEKQYMVNPPIADFLVRIAARDYA